MATEKYRVYFRMIGTQSAVVKIEVVAEDLTDAREKAKQKLLNSLQICEVRSGSQLNWD